MDLVIVTGMSGAGKSRAVQALEDIGALLGKEYIKATE